MLDVAKTGDEIVVVPMQMTKHQIASLFYTEVRAQAHTATHSPVKFIPRDKEERATLTAKRLLKIAAARTTFFDRRYFDDPSWHLLLDLYVQQSEGRETSVSSACVGTLAAPTTALRHLQNLTNDGLIIRIPDPDDNRRVYVRLSHEVRDMMTELLDRPD